MATFSGSLNFSYFVGAPATLAGKAIGGASVPLAKEP